MNKAPDNWRDGGLTPQIFGIDARAVFPWLFFIMHFTSWVLALICFVATVVFAILARLGFDPGVAWGRVLDWLVQGRFVSGPADSFWDDVPARAPYGLAGEDGGSHEE